MNKKTTKPPVTKADKKAASPAPEAGPKAAATRLADLPPLEMPPNLREPDVTAAAASASTASATASATAPGTPPGAPPPATEPPPSSASGSPPPLPGGKPGIKPGLPAETPPAALTQPEAKSQAKSQAEFEPKSEPKPDPKPEAAPPPKEDERAPKAAPVAASKPPALPPASRTLPSLAPPPTRPQLQHPPRIAHPPAPATRPPPAPAQTAASASAQPAALSPTEPFVLPSAHQAMLRTDGNAALAPRIEPPADPSPEPAGKQAPDADLAAIRNEASADLRRTARRRPAGPPRERIAANDDAPSIGGLIYALNQRPSGKPFLYAAAGSAFWSVLAITFAVAFMPAAGLFSNGLIGLVANPWFPTLLATILGPVALFGFLALLAWRTEELHLRSTAMTEVAVRLAEPDRMAEQSVASLGQAVRRQVSFMNDAVSRALGRAGELEALVHNEVSALEHSYEENERKIRGLIDELASERHSLVHTGNHFEASLHRMTVELPQLMAHLSDQQLKLTSIIESAGQNLTQLETSLAGQTGRLETALESGTVTMGGMLGTYTEALGTALTSRTSELQALLEDNADRINTKLVDRTATLQTVFEEYALALDATLANRAEALDSQLVERTRALDDAFNDRLRLFDESVLRSTMAIDAAVGENTKSLTNAMEVHARQLGDSIAGQAAELDETLMKGINSVRSTSENISRQSLKAIEGLASQSDLLRNVSENLLNQISSVTSRFENQGQAIMRSANALEATNYKIEQSLAGRTEELNSTLDRMSGKAEELSRVVEGYSTSLEGSLTGAEQRARLIASEISKETEARSRAALDELHRTKLEASRDADRALDELRREFTNVSNEVSQRLGQLTHQFATATGSVRDEAAAAARDLEQEQARLKQQLDRLPGATEETASHMRRALNDQLRALDRLSSIASRTGMPDVTYPARPGLPAPGRDHFAQSSATAPTQGLPHARGLSSLTSTVAREIAGRPQRTTGPLAGAGQPAAASPQSETWSLGDLLARASGGNEDAAPRLAPSSPRPDMPPAARPTRPQIQPQQIQPQQIQPQQIQAPAARPESGLDIKALSRALDPTTAASIWSRFQAGQRGFMVRSIYAPESRNLFDGIARRYRADEAFKRLVDRFLNEYQNELVEADTRDPTGSGSQRLIQEATGRVYLILAHASGRLI